MQKIQYEYIKQRSQFGRQCIFNDEGPTVEENIPPNPELGKNYIELTEVHRGVQKSAQLAAHEVQTFTVPMKHVGMFHTEGGWPKEINPKDTDTMYRFRRRIEKSDHYNANVKGLAERMEFFIKQNNAVNIHQHYFDDMVPTPLVHPHNIRNYIYLACGRYLSKSLESAAMLNKLFNKDHANVIIVEDNDKV